jgi:acyl-CoA dehydrogenase
MEAVTNAAVIAACDGAELTDVLIASAKGETSRLVRDVTAVSHQLHGAIGCTQEYRLGDLTKRLWAWRDEYGNEWFWNQRMASLLEAKSFDVWELLTGVPASREYGGDL